MFAQTVMNAQCTMFVCAFTIEIDDRWSQMHVLTSEASLLFSSPFHHQKNKKTTVVQKQLYFILVY